MFIINVYNKIYKEDVRRRAKGENVLRSWERKELERRS